MQLEKSMIHYNHAQKQAIEHKEGPMLVLAGPGSGKTAVITGRLSRLIQKGISPSSILVVTFTRAAAAEMKERFLSHMGKSSSFVTFGTFHGVFYGILRQTYRISGNNIISEDQKNQLLREILSGCYSGAEEEADLPAAVSREISTVKNARMDLAHFYSASLPQEIFRKVYKEYSRWMEENKKLDFDDIMVWCYRLFTQRPEILQQWQQKFQYILVDEFQDISPLQYDIVKMLAEPEKNLFIVGDDDQSIYRFRGANPEIMLGFTNEYPDAAVTALEVNYRSTPQILACSGRLIEKNQKRFPKTMIANRHNGEPVEFQLFEDGRKETTWLAEEIRKTAAAGTPYREMAVLVRMNQGCRGAVEQLMSWQIPFCACDVIPCLYDHWIARNVRTYLGMGAGSRKRGDFLQICNRPNRYLSREAFYEPLVNFEQLYQYYEEKEWMWERIEKLEEDLKILSRLSPYGAVQYVRHGIGYESYLKEYAQNRHIPEAELMQVLDELAESAKGFSSFTSWEAHIEEYRRQLQQEGGQRQEKEGVMISTLHASKGMEYDVVYILDVNEGIVPYQKAILEADLEEERRMLYVGMTRARKKLYLCAIKERYEKKLEVSRFLSDISSKFR